jgi:hypothetical protein
VSGATTTAYAEAWARIVKHGGEASTAANTSIFQELTAYLTIGVGSGRLSLARSFAERS